jgi:hypothetical protein
MPPDEVVPAFLPKADPASRGCNDRLHGHALPPGVRDQVGGARGLR